MTTTPGSIRIPRIGSLLSVAAVTMATACAESSSSSTGADASLDGPDRPVALTTAEVASVGALDGAEWETFAGVRDVAFDASGNLYIFDPDNHRIVVTDREGRHLRTLGREGAGPGELRQPNAMAVGRDGAVVVADGASQAFVVYDDSGAFVRQVPFAGEHGMPFGDLAMRPTGDLLTPGRGMVLRMGTQGAEEPAEPDFVPVRAISPVDGTETVLYEGWLAPQPEATDAETLRGENTTIVIRGRRLEAFRAATHVAVLPDGGLAVADSVDWSLDILAPDGAPRDVLRRPIDPRPVTDQIRELERERRLTQLEEGGSRIRLFGSGGGAPAGIAEQIREMQRGQIETMAFADVVPVIYAVAADWEGRLWVRRTGEVPGEDGPIDLVGADGTYFGTLPAGSFDVPRAFGPDGLAAWVETDDFDVEHVVVRRIAWPPEPGS